MLPKTRGLEICKTLRNAGSKVPIIMLTARGQEIDKVLGLKLGADDYVTKPFSFLELMARVEAVLRRSSREAGSLEAYRFGDVSLDFRKYEATKGNRPLDLSPREFEIIKYFIEHRGQVVTRDQLLDAVWGYDSFPLTRTVDMHIAKLRQKIEATPGDPRFIITVHRLGYKFTG
jgi:DNA-binding response OmpR family regulator